MRSGADGEGSGLWGGEGLGGGGGGERGLGEGCHAGGRGEGRRGAANLHGSGSTGMLKAGSGVGEGEAERQRLSDAACDSVVSQRVAHAIGICPSLIAHSHTDGGAHGINICNGGISWLGLHAPLPHRHLYAACHVVSTVSPSQ